jgi:hypothetical protein
MIKLGSKRGWHGNTKAEVCSKCWQKLCCPRRESRGNSVSHCCLVAFCITLLPGMECRPLTKSFTWSHDGCLPGRALRPCLFQTKRRHPAMPRPWTLDSKPTPTVLS